MWPAISDSVYIYNIAKIAVKWRGNPCRGPAYIVDGSCTPLLQIPILAIFYSLPAVIAGLLLYLFYWLIWGKKQKVKWLEYAETNDKEKPRLYDKHTAVKEEQELPE